MTTELDYARRRARLVLDERRAFLEQSTDHESATRHGSHLRGAAEVAFHVGAISPEEYAEFEALVSERVATLRRYRG
jgi:hypothetical protein